MPLLCSCSRELLSFTFYSDTPSCSAFWPGGLSGQSVRRDLRKRVSIILAVRDGERWIARKLETLAALDYPQELIEILIVSDGSTDATASIVEEAAKPNIRLFRLPPGGKAIALNHAIRHATGEILFFTDVRQTLEPSSLQNLVDCFADPQVGVASGELIIVEGETLTEVNVGLYWKYEKLIRKRLSRLDSVLGATGCIYAMRRELAVELPAGTLLDDVHLPLSRFLPRLSSHPRRDGEGV